MMERVNGTAAYVRADDFPLDPVGASVCQGSGDGGADPTGHDAKCSMRVPAVQLGDRRLWGRHRYAPPLVEEPEMR